MEQTNNKKMKKKEFWARLGGYVMLGGIIPFVFLVWRFHLFSKVDKLAIGGWGVLGIIITAIFFMRLIKAVKKGMPYSYGTQVLTVICKISIPLMVLLTCCYFFRDIMEQISQFLGVLFVCETGAGFINPLPKWSHDNQIKEQENVFKQIFASLKKEDDKI